MAREDPLAAAPGVLRRRDLPRGWRSFDLDRLSVLARDRLLTWRPARPLLPGAGAGATTVIANRVALVLLVLLLAVPAALVGLAAVGVLALQRRPLPLGEEAEFYGDDWPVE